MDSIIVNGDVVYDFPAIDAEELFQLKLGKVYMKPLYDDNTLILQYIAFKDADDSIKAIFVASSVTNLDIFDIKDKIDHIGVMAYKEFVPYSAEAIQDAYDELIKSLTVKLQILMLDVCHDTFEHVKSIVTDPHRVYTIPQIMKFYDDVIDIATHMTTKYMIKCRYVDDDDNIIKAPIRHLSYELAECNLSTCIYEDEAVSIVCRNIGDYIIEYAVIPSILNGMPNETKKPRFYQRYPSRNMLAVHKSLEKCYDLISTYIEEEIHDKHQSVEETVCTFIRLWPNTLYAFEVFCNMIIHLAKCLNYEYSVVYDFEEVDDTEDNEEPII